MDDHEVHDPIESDGCADYTTTNVTPEVLSVSGVFPQPPNDPINLARLGELIRMSDAHLIDVIAMRMRLAQAVEHSKTVLGFREAIFRSKPEKRRLKMVKRRAKELGINPNFAAALLYLVIDESCKVQMIQREATPGTYLHSIGDLSYRELKQNLLELCRAVAEGYDDSYTSNHPATQIYLDVEREIISRLVAAIDPRDRRVALDIGCATGSVSFFLAQYFDVVKGVDISEHMIDQARKNAGRRGKLPDGTPESQTHHRIDAQEPESGWGIGYGHELSDWYTARTRFLQGDVESEEYWRTHEDDSVDLVVMTLGTGSDIHVDSLAFVLKQIKRVLRRGGKFLLSFYNRESLICKFPLLPWAPSLAAVVDLQRNCLDVHTRKSIYSLYARAYTQDELADKMPNGLSTSEAYTCPVVSATYPPSVFEIDGVLDDLRMMDRTLTFEAGANQGAYILLEGSKM